MGLPAYSVGSVSAGGMGSGSRPNMPSMGSGGGRSQDLGGEPFIQSSKPQVSSASKQDVQHERRTRVGMKLIKKPQAQGLLEQIRQEGETSVSETASGQNVTDRVSDTIREAVEISMIEQISCAFESDGGLRQMQIIGEFLVNVTEEIANHAQITIEHKDDLQLRIHPNVNRDHFTQKSIVSLISTKAYPLETPTAVLKWRHQSNNDAEAPLLVSVWPSVGMDSRMVVTVEYVLAPQYDLTDVSIKLNIVGKSTPIVNTEQGSSRYDTKNNLLEWSLPLINRDNPRGSLEFVLEQWDNTGDTSWLYPVSVNFNSITIFANIKIVAVLQPNGESIPFSVKKQLQVHQYTVGSK